MLGGNFGEVFTGLTGAANTTLYDPQPEEYR